MRRNDPVSGGFGSKPAHNGTWYFTLGNTDLNGLLWGHP